MPAQENFRANLQTAMDRGGISQYEMNRKTSIARAYINNVLLGTCIPSLHYAEKLAAGVGYPLALMLIDPEKFKEIATSSVSAPKISEAEVLTRDSIIDSPTPPAVARSRHNKTKKHGRSQAKTAEENRLIAWVGRILRQAEAG